MVEQSPFKRLVTGSIPVRVTLRLALRVIEGLAQSKLELKNPERIIMLRESKH